MRARKRTARAVRERQNEPPSDLEEELTDRDEEAAEEEAAVRSGAVVRPIRDEPDELVFRFEVGPAILGQLLEKLKWIPPMPLMNALGARYPGFYQLFLGNQPKYIGKTARPIGQRLKEHARKLRHRTGIDFDAISCKYAFVEDPSLVDVAEGALIDFFGAHSLAEWNASGFGSKVTGHRRGQQDASEWAQRYPADLRVNVLLDLSGPVPFQQLVKSIKSQSPITLSVPKRMVASFQRDHDFSVELGSNSRSFEEWMNFIEQHLATGWRINRQAESWYIEPGV